ncbi:E3 ubiquitin-protein ligase hrd1 [Rhodotorula mucilaginosa]|uniref:E3 ubiquitin-protein ligase hrd1 n=1 Tax=Rhodotorula mucilaginosa TaxID=5537 RepID=A0A9P6W0J2_RHOMI|nr:E3 ubiquitin-protein ligase hrd1 [Rhodotorula mucilaginosa]
MAPRRLVLWGLASTLLAIATVVHAFRMRSNFYAAAVYLAKSNACTMILWNQGIFQTVMLGKAIQAVFLGDLRLIEIERLQERGWFAITETLLALTIFKDDFESTFVLLFVGLLFLKVFHWLASDRVEMMEQAARVSRLAHARMLGLLSLLWIADIACLIFAVESIMIDGPTVMIMPHRMQYLILIATVWTLSAKYLINCIDMRSEAPWEEKSIYVFYVELAADFFKLCTYLTFFGLILTFYGLPLNILRDVYLTLRSFILKVRDLRRYRQATRNMDELYPNASREEMDAMADKTCIICREDMEWRPAAGEAARNEPEAAATDGASANEATDTTGEVPTPAAPATATAAPRTGPNDTPKKLPRRPVLPNEQPTQPPRAAAPQFGGPAGDAAAAAAQPANRSTAGGSGAASAGNQGQDVPFVDPEDAAIRQAQVNLARNLGREAFTSLFPGIPFPPEVEAENPRGSGSGGRANSSATAPTLTTQRSSSLLSPPAASVAGGHFASGLGVTAPPSAAGTGDNPLARFSLPDLPVPSAGEASLFQEPPSFVYASPDASTSSTYSNLAYGAYPRNRGGGGGTSYSASPFASVQQPPNIIERLETVRRRWTAQGTPPNASAAESSDGPRQNSADAAPAPEAESSTSAFTAAEKGKSKEVEEDSTAAAATEDDISPREAACRAAERRLGRLTQTTEDSTKRPESPGASLPADSVTTDAQEAAHPPDHAKTGRSATALPTPRLIPLFDPAHPTPFVRETRAWTPIELEGAVTKTLEDKLRTLAEFQERLDSLIGDLRTAMGT